MSGLPVTNVSISISTNPLSITYSPDPVTVSTSTDIIYTVTTSGWNIIGIGKANTDANQHLTYNSKALPKTVTPQDEEPIHPYLPVSASSSVTICDTMGSTACACKFSFIFSNGGEILTHDPQVTNDPG